MRSGSQYRLEVNTGHLLFLAGIREEAHFHEHCRHIRRFEHGQRRAVDRPRRQRDAILKASLQYCRKGH
jgi:hypothetical protein